MLKVMIKNVNKRKCKCFARKCKKKISGSSRSVTRVEN